MTRRDASLPLGRALCEADGETASEWIREIDLNKTEFKRLLKVGLGRAIVYLQAHDAMPYQDIILEACLHNWAFDRQCENNRAQYMFDIIQITPEVEFYRQSILSALKNNIDGDREPQLYDLAKLFAQSGDAEARAAMYDHFIANVEGDHFDGLDLIDLDGLEGFLFVANAIGESILPDEVFWEDESLLEDVEKRFGIEAVSKAAAQASKTNPRAESFVDAVLKKRLGKNERSQHTRPDPTGLSYVELKPQIFKFSYKALVQWGKETDETELNQAAVDLLRETDERWLRSALLLFYERPFPLDCERLIALTGHDEYTLSKRAFMVLGNVRDARIREFALKIMKSNEPKGDAVGLLVKNFQEGDHALVEAFLPRLLDENERHVAGSDIQEFYAAHPNPESEVRALLTLYEYGPCTNCRKDFVKRLMELNALPDWVSKECQYDADVYIRALVMQENGT